MASVRTLFSTGAAVVTTVKDREVTFLAASIAYYTLVSLIPLLVLSVVVASLIGGPGFTERIEAVVAGYLLPTGAGVVSEALADRTSQGGLGVLSFGLTTWGALKVFRGLDTAVSRIYGVPTRGLASQLTEGAVALGSLALGFAAVVVLGAAVALVDLPLVEFLAPVALLGTLSLAFLPLYYLFPDVETTVREALPGAAFAAVGWTGLGIGFGVYVDAIGSNASGALGGVLLLVTWFYVSATVVLTGAVLNVVLAGRDDDAGSPAADAGGPSPAGSQAGGSGDADPATARPDRQLQQGPDRRGTQTEMSGDTDADDEVEPRGAPDVAALDERVAELRADLDAFESEIEDRTVDRPAVEAELKRYVRARMRRGHARGWGPYLVLLYGVVLALGAFYFLEGVWAILAMLVTFLSTLGLYAVFVAVGVGLNLLGIPGKTADFVRDRR